MSRKKGYQVFGLSRTGPAERSFEPLNAVLAKTVEEGIKIAKDTQTENFVIVEFEIREIIHQPKFDTGRIVACNLCLDKRR